MTKPNVTETLKSGSRRDALMVLRAILAERMVDADPNVVAQIAARFQAVLADLAALPSLEKTEVDDLSERRQARGSAANAKLRAKQRRGA